MQTERITIDCLPPTSNHMYEQNRVVGKRKDGSKRKAGGRRLSEEALAWKLLITLAVLRQRIQPPQDWRKVPCRIVVHQDMTGTRKQDTTGGLKMAEDAVMEALTGLDSRHHADGYVEKATIERHQHAEQDRTTITVEEKGEGGEA